MNQQILDPQIFTGHVLNPGAVLGTVDSEVTVSGRCWFLGSQNQQLQPGRQGASSCLGTGTGHREERTGEMTLASYTKSSAFSVLLPFPQPDNTQTQTRTLTHSSRHTRLTRASKELKVIQDPLRVGSFAYETGLQSQCESPFWIDLHSFKCILLNVQRPRPQNVKNHRQFL